MPNDPVYQKEYQQNDIQKKDQPNQDYEDFDSDYQKKAVEEEGDQARRVRREGTQRQGQKNAQQSHSTNAKNLNQSKSGKAHPANVASLPKPIALQTSATSQNLPNPSQARESQGGQTSGHLFMQPLSSGGSSGSQTQVMMAPGGQGLQMTGSGAKYGQYNHTTLYNNNYLEQYMQQEAHERIHNMKRQGRKEDALIAKILLAVKSGNIAGALRMLLHLMEKDSREYSRLLIKGIGKAREQRMKQLKLFARKKPPRSPRTDNPRRQARHADKVAEYNHFQQVINQSMNEMRAVEREQAEGLVEERRAIRQMVDLVARVSGIEDESKRAAIRGR